MGKRLFVVLCATFLAGACEKTERPPASDAGSDATADARDGGADAPRDTGHDAPDGGAPEVRADAAADAPTGDGPGDAPADAGAADAPADAPDATADARDAADAAPEVWVPMLVTVDYTGTVATVAGTPLGLDSTIRTAPVSGSFSYDLRSGDSDTTASRGTFACAGGCPFTFTVGTHTVTGSGMPVVQTENNLPPDTFRYNDGGNLHDGITRIMKLDGTDDATLALGLSITDSTGALLASDALPNPFPTVDLTKVNVTFSISDSGGTLLMQLDTLTPR
jgi:hypothetical protein